jgi:hypothetical protein
MIFGMGLSSQHEFQLGTNGQHATSRAATWPVVAARLWYHYVANTITSLEEIRAAGYAMEPTNMLVNCPIVPEGSSARLRARGVATVNRPIVHVGS